MASKTAFLAVLSLFLGFVLACGEPSPETGLNHSADTTAADSSCVQPINPNGDSEMSLLMRSMFDSLRVYRNQAKAGENPSVAFTARLSELHTAQLTDETIRGPVLESFTRAFIQQADSLMASPQPNQETYNNLVASCITCHAEFCPGPIMRIKKLKWK